MNMLILKISIAIFLIFVTVLLIKFWYIVKNILPAVIYHRKNKKNDQMFPFMVCISM